ncbi:unnamed protein product [Tuber melanosporum]|uniref:(Perigord truffle) hypothetical protein n=1 Tax=Tuber melanosporum (strain Mel28) TaxID=656061 RepID=D5GBZ6_TUBMM|nr:uncharacterized protein GSTUM_00005722001 [Tuber melanosporum]CAZ82039.1 unnamed protein product [Tuber melanosporum]
MPNKKGRKKNLPKIDYDLPTPIAQSPTKKRKRSRKADDDTPREFTRLLSRIQQSKPKPNGLDDPPTKSQKPHLASELKIQPSESLRQFNRRIDASLRITLKPGGSSKAQRAKEKKRERAKPTSVAHGGPNDGDSEGEAWGGEGGKRERGRNKGRAVSPDPWAALAEKRLAVKFSDFAKAPPTLVKPKSVLHSCGIADVEGVPKSSGGLARREGLAGERRGIVEGYRRMVEERRGGKGIGS